MKTKIASQKSSKRSEENNPPGAKLFFGFVKRISEFAKRIYETFDCNFFNVAIIIVAVFSIAQFTQFILFFTFCLQ